MYVGNVRYFIYLNSFRFIICKRRLALYPPSSGKGWLKAEHLSVHRCSQETTPITLRTLKLSNSLTNQMKNPKADHLSHAILVVSSQYRKCSTRPVPARGWIQDAGERKLFPLRDHAWMSTPSAVSYTADGITLVAPLITQNDPFYKWWLFKHRSNSYTSSQLYFPDSRSRIELKRQFLSLQSMLSRNVNNASLKCRKIFF